MISKKILIIDDDAAMRRAMLLTMIKVGYEARAAQTAGEAFAILAQWQPALILLDIGLPDMDGYEAFQQLRKTTSAAIIFVTSRHRELDEIIGLELGADDYISKPFNMDVLLSRVKTALRHAHEPQHDASQEAVSVGDITLEPRKFHATLKGQPLDMAPREFDLLLYLANHVNEVLSVEDILMGVWGEEWIGETQTVYVHMRGLRKKIESDPANPQRLLTIRGVGYKFVESES